MAVGGVCYTDRRDGSALPDANQYAAQERQRTAITRLSPAASNHTARKGVVRTLAALLRHDSNLYVRRHFHNKSVLKSKLP